MLKTKLIENDIGKEKKKELISRSLCLARPKTESRSEQVCRAYNFLGNRRWEKRARSGGKTEGLSNGSANEVKERRRRERTRRLKGIEY